MRTEDLVSAVRIAGGIVHKDGNIFFSDMRKLLEFVEMVKHLQTRKPEPAWTLAKPVAKQSECTAKVHIVAGVIRTESCITKKALLDCGGSSDGEKDYYVCPDCGKEITADYREN